MLDKQHGRFYFECDVCGAVHEAAAHASFEEAWETAKEEGWQARKLDEEEDWRHTCPVCDPIELEL